MSTTTCHYRTISVHHTSQGRVSYEACACGAFRVRLGTDLLAEPRRGRRGNSTAVGTLTEVEVEVPMMG
jgi:hypothetical protein